MDAVQWVSSIILVGIRWRARWRWSVWWCSHAKRNFPRCSSWRALVQRSARVDQLVRTPAWSQPDNPARCAPMQLSRDERHPPSWSRYNFDGTPKPKVAFLRLQHVP